VVQTPGLVLGIGGIGDRQQDMRWSYVLWQEFVSPFLVVELLSPGTEDEDLRRNIRELGKPPIKWEVYEKALRVPFYVVFDRYENTFRLFSLVYGKYQERQLDENNPQFWFDELDLGLGVWSGSYEGFEGQWLRWYDNQGEWIPTAIEQTETKRSARTQAEAKLTAAIPQLIGLGLSVEQVVSSLGLTIAEVEQALIELQNQKDGEN